MRGLLLYFVLIASCMQVHAKPLNKQKVREELKGLDYIMEELENKPKKDEPKPSELESFKTRTKTKSMGVAWLKYLIYGLAIAALSVLLFFLLQRFRFSQKAEVLNEDILLGDAIPESETLRRANLDKLISKENDPKAIIRLHFLKVLQKLVRSNLLSTSPSKTNRQYIRDLSNFISLAEFKQLVTLYEEAWFSSRETNEAHANTAEELKSKISKTL